ncbi:MAG TPA: Holliday junction branch migration protein RuvA [Bacillota bacterium]|nr:Holliday junction branch migration protein RuvA [Bacillota bacterium]
MFHYIRGILAAKFQGTVVIEAQGIGYEIAVPLNSRVLAAGEGEELTVFTYMAVKEDDIALYGFEDEWSLDLFKKLISVSGIGAKAGLAVLSAMSAEEIKKAIIFEDADMLTRAQGIGKKSAQRIVLELKDKLGTPGENGYSQGAAAGGIFGDNEKEEALNAMIALGYSRSEAAKAMAEIKEKDLTAEEYIRVALKKL